MGVTGNLVTASFPPGGVSYNEVAEIRVGTERLKAEVIRIDSDSVRLQVFEDTRGIRVGDPIEFQGELLAATLAPGLLGGVYDGLQNPLSLLDNRQGYFLKRGQLVAPIDTERRWSFTPTVDPKEQVQAGTWLGWVRENHLVHRVLAPLDLVGSHAVEKVVSAGEYTVREPVVHLRSPEGAVREVSMLQRWPVKRAVPVPVRRTRPSELLSTGCRVVDTLFPLARGGTACIPGPFGAGKTVLQQLVAKHAAVDVVIVIACGERAGEVVETLVDFPKLHDPRTGGSLMDRTVVICNTSSMPVAAREASVYTGLTIAEYYRLMGLDVLVLADSTSRWAQALREMSGRLEEIPGEEAFPAYLESRIANLYERAGVVEIEGGKTGALTLVGTISPAGGDFEEPVTQATLKVVGAFHGLDRQRADERRYPAIQPLTSWSLYRRRLADRSNATLDPSWSGWVDDLEQVLRSADEVRRMMAVVGEEGVSLEDLVRFHKGELADAVYLQQDAFDPVDAATPIDRQVADLWLLHRALAAEPTFADKAAARTFYTELTDALYQRNYCAVGSAEHRDHTARVQGLLEEE